MSTREQATADNTHPSQAQPEAQRKTGSNIGDKASGLVNIIHGTGEVIRGQAIETGDLGHGHGNGKAIAEAGREEVQRGLNKIEGKHARTSAATDALNGGGPHDGTVTGAAPVRDANAPRAPAAAPRADTGAWKARGDAQHGYPGPAGMVTGAGAGTASAAGGAVGGGGPGSDLRTNEQVAAPTRAAPPAPAPARGDRPAAATDSDGPNNVQRDTDTGVGSTTAPGDPGKQTRPSTNLPPSSGETGGPRSEQRTDSDEQFTAFAPPAGDRPAATGDGGPNVQRDTGVEPRPAPGDTGKQTRPATNLPLSGERVAQPEGQSFGTGAQMEQRSDRPTEVGAV